MFLVTKLKKQISLFNRNYFQNKCFDIYHYVIIQLGNDLIFPKVGVSGQNVNTKNGKCFKN